MVRRAGSGDDARADVPGERDGEAGNAAGAALDEDRLAALQLQRLLDGDDRRETDQRDGGRLHMAQLLGPAGDDQLADRNLLRISALSGNLAHAKHLVARLEVASASGNHAGEIASRHVRQRNVESVRAAAHLPVGGVDARRVDVDEHFTGGGNRIRQLAVFEGFGAAVVAKEAGFHAGDSI